jgi:diketogulonate reductase-like aldo/keto reductase
MNMPPILYGTAWKKGRTAELVSSAIREGFRGIDTACQPKHYHEAGVGEGVAACLNSELTRADLYLQTKFTPLSGQDPKNVPYDPRASLSGQVRQSFAKSLENLQTTYLDCLLLHSPLHTIAGTMEAWRAMEGIVDSNGVRRLGISNCYDIATLRRLHESARIKPAVVQNRFYAESGYDGDIRAFCRLHGMIYQSFWTLTANPRLLASQAVKAAAEGYRRTPAQILFRYLTQEGIVPLTGTTSRQHMREDLAIFEFELSQDERAAIGALL